MKSFLMRQARVLGVLGVLLCASQIAARADARKIPIVTRDNFVSLKLTIESDARRAINLVVAGNTISHSKNHGVGVHSAPLSNNQLSALLNTINRAGFSGFENAPAPPTAVRPQQTITLVISDETNRDRSFTIFKFGANEPIGFDEIAAALGQLSADKLADVILDTNPSDAITRQNLQSVQLQSLGGYAGIKSSILLSWPQTSAKPTLTWNQTIGGRRADRVKVLDNSALDPFIAALNAARLSQLNGKKFEQRGLYDGFHDTLTVILKDGRKFVVENYGDTAPAEYYVITRQLEILKSSAAQK